MKYVLKTSPGVINFTPYAMAIMSDGLFKASENYLSPDTPILNFFLLSASIELGLKSAILINDNSVARKIFLKSRKIGHDLNAIYDEFKKKFPNEYILDTLDIAVVKKINPFYKEKGLEYITVDVIVALSNGLTSFPSLFELRNVANKINDFLKKNKMFNS